MHPDFMSGRPIKMFYAYILKSLQDGSFYIGSTRNLAKRIERHNRGGNLSTRYKKPFEVVWKKTYTIYAEAVKEEKKIKSWKSRTMIENLIKKSDSAGGGVVNRIRL